MRARRAVVLTGALLAVLTGCASPGRGGALVAERFAADIQQGRWDRACAVLAPQTSADLEQSAGTACPAALAQEDLGNPGPVDGTVAFGTMTQVRFAQDTMFVARFRSGWKVMAAGCSPVPGHPYDCRLAGG